MISTFYEKLNEKLKVSLQGDACIIRLLCAFETKSNVLQYEYQVFRSKGIAGWPLVSSTDTCTGNGKFSSSRCSSCSTG